MKYNKLKIFLHVPKTAGTTLRAILEKHYGKSSVLNVYSGEKGYTQPDELKNMNLNQIKVINGHNYFGLHNNILGDNIINKPYLAMLRNPVDRIISYYNHVMQHTPIFKNNSISLMKFLNRLDKQVSNHQTRVISGVDFNINQCNDEIFEKAIENLENSFCFIGVTEKFNESLIVLNKLFGFKNQGYIKENISNKKLITKEFLSIEEINKIRNLNSFDLALYVYIKRMLNQKIKLLNVNMNFELSDLEIKNKALNT